VLTDEKVSTSGHNTEALLPLAKRWLATCNSSHKRCNRSVEPFTPSRLVSTSIDGSKLHIATDFASPPLYTTLSHCWGGVTFLTLTKANLALFQEKIPLAALSLTFAEAIRAARVLGFHYIWIDSLCIIQDDDDDWRREAGRMSQVYSSSSLNFAAAHAANGNEGLFSEKSEHGRLQIEMGSGSQKLLYILYPDIENDVLADTSLSKRGWCLQ
jgi:hypothetical protein